MSVKKLHVVTFGCQMNTADSELMASSFLKRGFELTSNLNSADAVLINTCTVRQRAEDKAMSQIGRLRKWKRERPHAKIFVAGCVAEKLGARSIKGKFPYVDSVIGAKSIETVDAAVEACFGKTREDAGEHIFSSPLSAYVTIMRGCSLKCSYCIVPSVRGEARCLPPEEILAEVRTKTEAGAREIVFLGQTVNAYAHKGVGGKTSFAGLLARAAEIEKVKRIRFMSPHPLFFDSDFFRLFADNPKIAKHIHLPVQSGSDRILKLMRRGYGRAQYLEILKKLRDAAPGAAVSTDFIVGYPGETEEDFLQTLLLIKESGFAFAFCFKYSQRTGGPELSPSLSEAELELRLERLLSSVKENSRDILNSRIGRMEEVLLETADFGKTSTDFNVKMHPEAGLKAGELVRAKIYGATKNILKGKLIP